MPVKFYHDPPWLPRQQNLGNLVENWLELGLHKRYVVAVVAIAVAVSVAVVVVVVVLPLYFIQLAINISGNKTANIYLFSLYTVQK